MIDDLISRMFSIRDDASFTEIALEVFRFQSVHNPVYKEYIRSLGREAGLINRLCDIPFLPVEFFKTHTIIPEGYETSMLFESSRTTSSVPSRHFIVNTELYDQSLVRSFNLFYGDPSIYCILALLPSFTERKNSSLAYMVNHLIRLSHNPDSGFYPEHLNNLAEKLKFLDGKQQRILLIGVSFAVMDLASLDLFALKNTIIMETGGMKGTRKEITREEMHAYLCSRFGTGTIHSEYGMTELLSQAYSTGNGIFRTPPWMKVLIREINDPLSFPVTGYPGGINIIDLANIFSCSFIETRDIGQALPDDSFKVLGRLDESEMRGCNLLFSD